MCATYPQWIPVNEALPITNQRVLFAWHNELGKHRTALGFYCRSREIEADWGEDVTWEQCEQDDDGDTAWLLEGWYEDSWVCGYYVMVLDVTHWMPLPARPEHLPAPDPRDGLLGPK